MWCCTLLRHVRAVTNIPIITAVTGFTSTTGRQYVLVFNEALYIKDEDYVLINPNQLHHVDTEGQDNPYHATDPMSITSQNSEFMVWLQSQRTNEFLNTWQPTKTQLSYLPHIVRMFPREWNPHKIEFPTTKYHVQEEIKSRNVSQTMWRSVLWRSRWQYLRNTPYLREVSVQNFAHALVQIAHEIVIVHSLQTPKPQKMKCQINADTCTLIFNDLFQYIYIYI